jgi:hypothetical protein
MAGLTLKTRLKRRQDDLEKEETMADSKQVKRAYANIVRAQVASTR